METYYIAFVLGKGLTWGTSWKSKGQVYGTFEEGSEATEESPKKGKRGWSRSRDVREDSGYNRRPV